MRSIFYHKIQIFMGIIVSISFFATLSAYDGLVVDLFDNPIEKAKIDYSNTTLWTDSKGKFEFNHSNYLKISKKGYYTQHFIFESKKNALFGEIPQIRRDSLIITLIEKKPNFNPFYPHTSKNTLKNSQSVTDFLSKHIFIKGIKLPGETKTASFLGQKSKNTLVFFNNIPLNLSGTPYDLSMLSVIAADSIFINTGYSKSFGGSSGSVLLENFAKTQKLFSLKQSLGSFGLQRSSFSASWFTGNYDLKLAVSQLKAENDFEYSSYEYTNKLSETLKRENNSKEIKNIFFGIDGQIFSYTFLCTDFYKMLPGPTNNLLLYDKAYSKGYEIKNGLNIKYKFPLFDFLVTLGYNKTYNRYDNSRTEILQYNFIGRHKFSSMYLKVIAEKNFENLKFTISDELKAEKFSYTQTQQGKKSVASISTKTKSFNTIALSGNYQKKYQLLRAGINSDLSITNEKFVSTFFESFVNYSYLGAGFGHGNSFVPASFYDKYWQAGQTAQGNPNLLPEKSTTTNIYLQHKSKKFLVKFSYFHTSTEDLISWQRFFSGWRPINIDKAEFDNYSLETELSFPKYFKTNFTFHRIIAIDKNSFDNQDIPYTPFYQLKAGVNFDYQKKIVIDLFYNGTGQQKVTRDGIADLSIDPYDYLNLSMFFKHSWENFVFSPSIFMNNILNKQYNSYEFYPRPGFNYQMGIGVTYKIK